MPEPHESVPDFSLREAVAADLPQVLDIYNHYVATSTVTFDEQPLALADLRAKFDRVHDLGFPFLVAEGAGGAVLGYAYVYPWRVKAAYRFTVENSIYLAEGATGNGIGRALMGELLECCRRAGLREVVAVIVDQGAEASVALHRRFGFRQIGRLDKVGYKFDRWLGTILMQKSLADEPPATRR